MNAAFTVPSPNRALGAAVFTAQLALVIATLLALL